MAWPGVTVDSAGFAAHAAATEATELAELYLAFACAHGDAVALAALDRDYLAPLRPALKKLGVAEVDEVLQRVREELLVGASPKILGYKGRGTLHGWLRSVAMRKGIHLLRGAKPTTALSADHGALGGDPELEYMKRRYGDAFQRAFATALAALPAADRLLLKQRFRHGMGVVDLGRQYGVNAGTITRRVQAARAALATGTRAQMMTSLGVGETDVASILRLIESQIDINLSVA